MAFEVKVPQMGESVQEGTIVEWKVKVGDKVRHNQPLVEIMTDKVNVEVPAETPGVIKELLAKPGDVVPVGAPLLLIDAEGEEPPEVTEPEPKHEPKEDKPAKEEIETHQKAAIPTPSQSADASSVKAIPGGGPKPKMPPAVRKMVRDHDLDPSTISGSGPGGRITREDVEKALAQPSGATAPSRPAAQPQPSAPAMPKYAAPSVGAGEKVEETIPLAGARKMIADHMVRSKAVSPHVTTFEDCDFTELVNYRRKVKQSFRETYGVNLTFMPFIMKAAVEGLKEFPTINASMTDQEIIIKKYYNIGFAVARESGLIVPVMRNVDKKSIIDIAVEMNALGEKARTEKLTLDDVQGGTFTVTNAGMFGATASTPIISQPQVAILGVHNISEKPVVRDGEIVIRHMSTFGMSFDHRLIDGHTAVQFLHRVIEYLENPSSLLLRLR